jgi:peptidoglycan hydrolase CwlO-like protein
MWVSRKRYKKMEADIDWLQAQVDALYTRVREHNEQIRKNTDDIHNNKHYISTPIIERGDTNVD